MLCKWKADLFLNRKNTVSQWQKNVRTQREPSYYLVCHWEWKATTQTAALQKKTKQKKNTGNTEDQWNEWDKNVSVWLQWEENSVIIHLHTVFFFLISSSIISAGLFTSVCGHFYIFNRIIIKAALMMLNKRYLFVCHDCPWFFFLSVWLNNKISLRGEQHTESHTGSLRKRKKNTDN